MGGSLLKEPWRTMPESQETLKRFLQSYKPENKEAKHVRILFHGPVGAGKSSFINSVDSVFQGRFTSQASEDETSGTTFTTKCKTYRIRKDAGSFYSFVFNDIMGIEGNKGVKVEDIKLALMGHVKEGYKFNPDRCLTENDSDYNSHPSLDDRVHILVSVVPVGSVFSLSDEVVKKMREIRLAASDMGIPQLAILTKPDDFSSKANAHIGDLYKSERLKEKVDEFSKLFGLPVKYIYLVKNYSSETIINNTMNTQILCALKQMLMLGEDFLNNPTNQPTTET